MPITYFSICILFQFLYVVHTCECIKNEMASVFPLYYTHIMYVCDILIYVRQCDTYAMGAARVYSLARRERKKDSE